MEPIELRSPNKTKGTDDNCMILPIHEHTCIKCIDKLYSLLSRSCSWDTLRQFQMRMKTTNNAYDTPLHCATAAKLVTVTKRLLEIGFDVNKRDEEGRIPLHIACESGDLECAKLLLESGSDVHALTNSGHIPSEKLLLLHWVDSKGLNNASKSKILEILTLLFKHGYRLNSTDSNYAEVTNNMIMYCPNGIVKLMVGNGINIRALHSARDGTYLHAAVRTRNVQVARELLNYIDVNVRTNDAETCLHISSLTVACNVIKCLLEHGADIEALDMVDKTPFDNAILNPFIVSVQAVDILLRWKCHITDRSLRSLKNNLEYYSTALGGLNSRTLKVINMKRMVVFKHLLKRIGASFHLNNFCMQSAMLDFLDMGQHMSRIDFLLDHVAEAKKMRNKMIVGNLSAYDIMMSDTVKIARYANTESMKQFFGTNAYLREFPLYANYLETAYKKATYRKSLINKAEFVLFELFSPVKLPRNAIGIITDALTNHDLRAIIIN